MPLQYLILFIVIPLFFINGHYYSSPLRVYRCAVCAKAFAEKHRAARHRREVHDRQDRLPCLLCESTFKTNSALNLHVCKKSSVHVA